MKYYVSWSGGKDSSATIILAHLHGIKIDRIVISLPYFDKANGIYADHPKHIEWVLNIAKPLFESWGYKVDVVSSDKDYLYWFYKRRGNKCKNPEYNGKLYGWLLGGMCKMNEEKTKPIADYVKALGDDYVAICGIGIDEPTRLERMHERGQISLLEQYVYTTDMAKSLCEEYGLLSPLYNMGRKRQGCWFCPNAELKEFASLKLNYPHLWDRLVELNKVKDTVTKCFKYDKTFDEDRLPLENGFLKTARKVCETEISCGYECLMKYLEMEYEEVTENE